MGKPRMYGMMKPYNPKLWRGLRDHKKPRSREIKTTGPVEGRTAKEKEAAE